MPADLASETPVPASAGGQPPIAPRSGPEVARLLASARAALDGGLSLPPARVTRAAGLLARTALERLVAGELTRRYPALGGASMRVQLICLSVLAGERIGAEAAWAWNALSSTCHHHAYELTPTAGEVEHLVRVVEEMHTAQQMNEKNRGTTQIE